MCMHICKGRLLRVGEILFTYLALLSYVGGGESHSSSGSKAE